MNLNERVRLIKPSATMAVTEQAAALRAKGIELIDFGAGEPDYDTPGNIKEAAVRALTAGQTKYTPVGGTAVLKQAIIRKLQRDNGLTYEASEVIASCGGKHSLYLAFQALFGAGDEVIVPAPYWVSYPDMLALAGARARIVQTKESEDFKMTAAALDAAVTPATRAVLINSPSNPAGVAYDEREMTELAAVIAKRNLLVISDNVYEMMVYGGFRAGAVLSVQPDLRDRTLIVNSVSKTYAMTGWRIGYTAGPREVIKAMSTLQGQMTSNPSAVAQAAAAEALGGSQDSVPPMMREFERRRDFIVPALNQIPGVRCRMPQGAFYVFPNLAAHLNLRGSELKNGDDLAAYLLQEARVAVVGGTDFGYPEHIRISYANSMENLRLGVERIAQALAALKAKS
ncbi:MAG: pyridoxal phosphate-dependent aminotransferase [Deltaproteobacteria bacterium]|nr:pyridoxal phosphate-dependent aminotransferase [Deltaproteobacteria bacterium]MBI3386754.1 pyridoxal phosphate-dependent aminotransferase [Deltaproteobacteria bacterium]